MAPGAGAAGGQAQMPPPDPFGAVNAAIQKVLAEKELKAWEREVCGHYCGASSLLKGKSDTDCLRELRQRHPGSIVRRQDAPSAVVAASKAALPQAERKRLETGGAAAAATFARSLTRWHVQFSSEAALGKVMDATRNPSGFDRPSVCTACGDGDWLPCPFATPVESYRNTVRIILRADSIGFRGGSQGPPIAGVRLGRAAMMPPAPPPPPVRSLADVAAGRSSRSDPYGVKKLVTDELARRRVGRDPANFATTEDELLAFAGQAVRAFAKRHVLMDACAVTQTRGNVRVVSARLHSSVDRAALEAIANSRAVAAEVALGAAESKADDQKRQPADGQPADPTSLPNGASNAVANVGDELSSLAVDLWEAAGLTVEWPCDPPDDSSPITCLTCMERTHRPGACELVATDECTVLQLVFATRVGNSWLDACDPLAAECKVLRWGTGMGGNGRDGATRLVHFFWWTKNPDSIVAAVTKVVAFAHRTDLVDYQIGTGASFVASIPNTCGTCGSNKHLPNQCPVVQLDLLGMGQDPTLASQVVLQARAASPAAPTPASAAASAAAASGASSRRVTEAEWTSWPETPIDKIGPHVWCRHEIIRGPGACRIDCKWAHLQHSMESTQRSILRCAHGRACPDMFHCRRDHGERASAQRAAAEAKEKAAAERRAAEEQEKERTHREKMARMELQRLKAVERARRAAARVAAATLPVPVAAMAAAVAVVAAPAAAPVPAIIQPNAPVPSAAAGPAGAAPAAVNVAPTVPAAGAPPVAPVVPTVAAAAVPAASVASTDAPADVVPPQDVVPPARAAAAKRKDRSDSPKDQRKSKAAASSSPARGKPDGVISAWGRPPAAPPSPPSGGFPSLPTAPRPTAAPAAAGSGSAGTASVSVPIVVLAPGAAGAPGLRVPARSAPASASAPHSPQL